MTQLAPTPVTAMPPIYRWCRRALAILFRIYFRLRVSGAEHVPATGPVILACNHASYADPPMVGVGVQRMCNYLARADLFTFPVFGWWLREVGVVPVDRDGGSAAGLRTILSRLRLGSAILLFPEGTRTRDGQLQPARAGVGLMVIKSGAPVVPVRVVGSYTAWGRHLWLPRPRQVEVRFGPVLRFEPQVAEARDCSKERLKALYQEVSDAIMAAIERQGQP
jgi:1-acyl-sn-glycerol-3-phosphate acyltransferase